MKIYDCFLFYNELDLLELRLEELYDHIDHFVLVEATTTFQSTPKELFFNNNKERYAKYMDKIIHVIIDDAPGLVGHGDTYPTSSAWINEIFQRNCIIRGLANADLDDIIIVCDADEILRPEVVDHMRANPKDVMGFRTPYFNVKLNYRLVNCPNVEQYCVWIVACKRKFLTEPEKLRLVRFNLTNLPLGHEDEQIRMYEHAGWHFTYQGNTEFVRNKIKSFAHTELNNSQILDNIDVDAMMTRGVGWNPRDPRPFSLVAVDEYFPNTIRKNLSKYQDMLVQVPGIPHAKDLIKTQHQIGFHSKLK